MNASEAARVNKSIKNPTAEYPLAISVVARRIVDRVIASVDPLGHISTAVYDALRTVSLPAGSYA